MADRRQVMAFRVKAQQLDRSRGAWEKTAVLDIGVQDTGPDGAMWALALRGVDVAKVTPSETILLWTIRGAPHLYRRAEAAKVAAAVEPFSDEDAGKRVFDASKPLKAAGIGNLEALDAIAKRMRAIVTKPTAKGEVSRRLAEVLPPPYLRFCRVCDATHLYEQPFRLAAVRAGLELQPGTSPPVLQRIGGFKKASSAGQLDLIRAYLRLLGPATPKHVADYLDAPLKDVKRLWPQDTVEVTVDTVDTAARERRSLLAADEDALASAQAEGVRLLGPFDLFLQARDRATIVPQTAQAKQLWPAIGRPGAVLADGEVAGTWRPRQSGTKFAIAVQAWGGLPAATRKAIAEQAEKLAAFRSVRLTGVDFAS